MSNNLFEIDKKKATIEEPEDAYNPDVSIKTEMENAIKSLNKLDSNLSSDTPNKTSDVSEDTLTIMMGDEWDGYFSNMTDIVSNEVGRITDEICCYESIDSYLTAQKNMLEQETVGSAKTLVNNTLTDAKFKYDCLSSSIKNLKNFSKPSDLMQNADYVLENIQNIGMYVSELQNKAEDMLNFVNNASAVYNSTEAQQQMIDTMKILQVDSEVLLDKFPKTVVNKFINSDFVQDTYDMPKQLWNMLVSITTTLSSIRLEFNLLAAIDTALKLRKVVAQMKDVSKLIEEGTDLLNGIQSAFQTGNFIGVLRGYKQYCKFAEKPSMYAAKYPFNSAYETEGGHIFETDNTPGKERLHIQHKTGTDVEISPKGDVVTNVKNDCQFIVEKNFEAHSKGNQTFVVDNTTEFHSKSMKLTSTEDLNISAKDSIYTTDALNLFTKNTLLTTQESCTIAANSGFSLSSGGPVYISSDTQIVMDAPTILLGTGTTSLVSITSASTKVSSSSVLIGDGVIKLTGLISLN